VDFGVTRVGVHCGHEMKIITPIHEPDVNTITHPPPSQVAEAAPGPGEGKNQAPADGPLVLEGFDDGRGGYEEPVIICHNTQDPLHLTRLAG
jgi:hypothetical protein